jgi:hypothetical protein
VLLIGVYGSYSILEQATLIEAVVAKRQLSVVHLVCHDYAVSVCQELVHRQNANWVNSRSLQIGFCLLTTIMSSFHSEWHLLCF